MPIHRVIHSPNMKMLAIKQHIYSSDLFDGREVWFLMDIKGKKTSLIGGGETIEVLTFTPDCRALLFAKSGGKYVSISRFDTRTLKTRRLFSVSPVVTFPEKGAHWFNSDVLALAVGNCGKVGTSRIVMLDLTRESLVLASPLYKDLMTFAGITKEPPK